LTRVRYIDEVLFELNATESTHNLKGWQIFLINIGHGLVHLLMLLFYLPPIFHIR